MCGGSLVSLPALALSDYTLLCLRQFVRHACMAYLLAAWCPWAHRSCVCFVVLCAFCVFLCCALCFGGPRPPVAFTHISCLTAVVSYSCRKPACGGGRAVLFVTVQSLWCYASHASQAPSAQSTTPPSTPRRPTQTVARMTMAYPLPPKQPAPRAHQHAHPTTPPWHPEHRPTQPRPSRRTPTALQIAQEPRPLTQAPRRHCGLLPPASTISTGPPTATSATRQSSQDQQHTRPTPPSPAHTSRHARNSRPRPPTPNTTPPATATARAPPALRNPTSHPATPHGTPKPHSTAHPSSSTNASQALHHHTRRAPRHRRHHAQCCPHRRDPRATTNHTGVTPPLRPTTHRQHPRTGAPVTKSHRMSGSRHTKREPEAQRLPNHHHPWHPRPRPRRNNRPTASRRPRQHRHWHAPTPTPSARNTNGNPYPHTPPPSCTTPRKRASNHRHQREKN